jgi:hypothetical protein
MHSETLLILLAAAALASAPAQAAKKERTDPATLKATGDARNCINSRSNVSTVPAGSKVLMFRTGANSWFRNDLRSACPNMGDGRALVFRAASSQYCELDTFEVVDTLSRINYGVCSLGRFTPVEVPKGTNLSLINK